VKYFPEKILFEFIDFVKIFFGSVKRSFSARRKPRLSVRRTKEIPYKSKNEVFAI